MGKTIFQSGYAPGGGITSGTTQYWQPNCPPTTQTTSEVICQHRIRTPGTFSNLQIRLGANSVTTNSTFRSRKNGANGGQTVTIIGSTTGLFEDTSGSDSVVDGDLVSVQMVPGSAGSMGITQFSQLFEATTNTVTKLSCNHVALSAVSANYYFPPGVDGINQTEAQAKLRIRKAGTFKKLAIYVQVARVSSASTLRSRKNGANGNLSVTLPAATTGWLEDTTNSDTVAVGDDYCLNVQNGGVGTDGPTYRGVSVDFESTANDGLVITGASAAVAFTEPTDAFLTLDGRLVANTTESNRAMKVNAAFVFSNISVYVTANTNTSNCVAEIRLNGFNTALSASITASSTGLFVDSTNTLNIAPGDDVLYHLGFPSVTGTQSTTLTWVAVWTEATIGLTRVTKSQIYKYNITGRVESPEIYRYSILSRVAALQIYRYSISNLVTVAKIYRYSILARAAQARIYRYSILQRAALIQLYLYSISNLVTSSKVYRYSISNLVTASKIYRYSVQARVSQLRTYLYNINSRVTNQEIYRYSILSLVSQARIYRYSMQGRVQQARIYRYAILNAVSLVRIYRYSILSRIPGPRIYRYSIQSRVSLPRTYIYNVGESGIERVSLTHDYLYNIVGRTQLSQTYRYSALQRVGTGALSLDGINDYIALGTDASLWNNALSSFTFTLWINPSIVGGDGTFRDLVNRGWGQNHGFTSYFNSSTKFFVVEIASTWPARIATATYSFVNLPANTWYHIAVVYDSADPTRVKLYVDCTLAPTGTNNAGEVLTNATQLLISSSASDYKGLVRDFRWFTNQALDMEDIQKVCADAPDAPPADYWLKMNEYAGNPIDTVSGTKVGTLQNGPKWIQNLNAISCDGIDDYLDLGTQTTFYWGSVLTKFSFSVWVYVRSLADANRVFANHGLNVAQSFGIFRDVAPNSDRVIFRIVKADAAQVNASSTIPAVSLLNRWCHFVFTYDNSLGSQNIKGYMDGALVASGNVTETISLPNIPMTLGAGSGQFANCFVKDFRWWTTKPLTQAEVTKTFNNEPDAPTPDYWLKINEGTGNPVDDTTGTKTAALTAGATWVKSAPDVWLGNAQRAIYGILNRVSKTIAAASPYAVTFDGIDDMITIPNIGAINNLDDFTISLWIYPITPNASSTPHVFNKLYPSNNGFILYFTTNTFFLNFRTVNNTGVGVSVSDTSSITSPRWYHIMVTFVRSTGAMKLYVDGILRSSGTNTGLLANSVGTVANLSINGAANPVKWGGNVKDFRLWRSAQDAEITKIYNNDPTAPTPNYWLKMEEGSGNPKDTIAPVNEGLLQNGASWIESAPDIFLGKIQKYIYNILGRVALTRNYLYNINARISQLRIYRYGILTTVSLARLYNYSILGRITQPRIYRYGILQRAALSRIYRYSILQRAALARIYRYGILQRAALANIYRYGILSRRSLARIYRYSIGELVSRSRIYRYNIIARVSKAFTFSYNILEPPSPIIWQLTGQKTDFPQKLEDMIINYLAAQWSITNPALGPTPIIKQTDIPQHVAQIDNFAFDNHRTYYIKVAQTASEVQTRKIRMNTYEFATPIEFECFSRRLTKGEAFKELNNMINELMRIFGQYNKEQLFGIQGITFNRISNMDRERPAALTIWSRRFRIILHYYKVSVIG